MATLNRRRPAPPPPPIRPTLTTLTPTSQAPGLTTPTSGKTARQVTVGEYIVDQVTAGVDPITAAGCAGVLPGELQAWIREGALAFERLNAGDDWHKAFTPEQQHCALFTEQVTRARSLYLNRLSSTAQRLAVGEFERRRTTTRRRKPSTAEVEAGADEYVVEVTELVEVVLPDAEMIRWLLEHGAPDVYGKRARLDVTVQDMTDTEVVEDVVERRMREAAAALMAAAIETTGRETN